MSNLCTAGGETPQTGGIADVTRRSKGGAHRAEKAEQNPPAPNTRRDWKEAKAVPTGSRPTHAEGQS
eukprot:5611740-Alexandrium_andersonii.AAC.1